MPKIGALTHYCGKLSGVVVCLDETLTVYNLVSFDGSTADYLQGIDFMLVDNQGTNIIVVEKEAAIKVKDRVRTGDNLSRLK